MLAVIPLHWDDLEIRRKERFDEKIYPAISGIWKGYGINNVGEGFWIHGPTSSPILIKDK